MAEAVIRNQAGRLKAVREPFPGILIRISAAALLERTDQRSQGAGDEDAGPGRQRLCVRVVAF